MIEELLLKRATEYQGYDNIKEQLIAEMKAMGYTDNDEIESTVTRVLERVDNIGTGVQRAFGKAHDPNRTFNTIAKKIKDLKSF